MRENGVDGLPRPTGAVTHTPKAVASVLSAGYFLFASARVVFWVPRDPLAMLLLPGVILECAALFCTVYALAWAYRIVTSSKAKRPLASLGASMLLLVTLAFVLRLCSRSLAVLVGPSDEAFNGFVGTLLSPGIRWDPVVRAIVTEHCRIAPERRLQIAREEAAAETAGQATGSFAFLLNVPRSAARNLGRGCDDLATQSVLLAARDPFVRSEVINNPRLDRRLCAFLGPLELSRRRAMGMPACPDKDVTP